MIHGILSLNGDISNKDFITSMAESMKDICPDGVETWQQEGIALAANLLQTLPHNRHETQPVLVDLEAGLRIVADARIDNREELCTELGFLEAERKAISDVRLILEAYKKWGEECAEKLIGDFSFVIWEQKTKKLFCCRDVFALRPFYYYASKEWFVFSSDLDTLLALDFIPKELNEKYLASKLGGLNLCKTDTFYQDIYCLEDAHFLIVKNKTISTKRYWEPDFSKNIHFEREEEYVERYLELFTEAVRCRLASHVPVASFISGGLDSSSISVVAARLLSAEGKSTSFFCHVLPEAESNPEKDERNLVELLEKEKGLDVTWIARDSFDEKKSGFFDTTLNIAHNRGHRVILGGYGGDQAATCHAIGVTSWNLRARDLRGFMNQIKACAAQNNRSLLRTGLGSLYRFYSFQTPVLPDKDIREHLFENSYYNKTFADSNNILELARSSHRFARNKADSFRENMWNDLAQDGRTSNKINKKLSQFQLETRRPMFDRRLVEYCLAIPAAQHRLGMGRRLIRRAMEGYLPAEIRLRDNKRFSSCPGIRKSLAKTIDEKIEIIERAAKIPEIGGYIDLEKMQKRLKALPELVAQGKQKDFRMGAVRKALSCAEFLTGYFQNKK